MPLGKALVGRFSGTSGARRRSRLVWAVAALAGVPSLALSACGSAASSNLALSASSGHPGSVINVSGNAGSGCSPGQNWFGFDFGRYGRLSKGPMTQMTAPVSTGGTWSAQFEIPSYLGGLSATSPGSLVTPGRYEIAATSCHGHVLAKASFQVTSGSAPPNEYVGITATSDGQGYWLVQADGKVTAFGDAHFYGSLSADATAASAPIVAMARTYTNHGYWLVSSIGHVYPFGDAKDYGSLPARLAAVAPITSIAVTPNGQGYWLLAANGHIFGFGDASLTGMPNSHLAPYDAIVTRPDGGYIVTAANYAAVFVYPGGALVSGGPGNELAANVVGAAPTPSGNGVWQAGMDGGVITWGDAGLYGSVPSENVVLKSPVTAIAGSPDGRGYWMLTAHGAVLNFGDAKLFGAPTKN
ncbi:MAG: hypothetical protein ACP5VR_06025 [Acidimicrobiales bacterium]